MKAKPFRIPAPEEVAAYAREIGYAKLADDPGAFCDYYETCGWRTNHGPMRNWQAAVRNWRRMDLERGTPAASPAAAERAEREERRRKAEERMRDVLSRYAEEWVAADGWQRNPAPVRMGGRLFSGPADPAGEKRRIETKARDAYGAEGARILRECIREALARKGQ